MSLRLYRDLCSQPCRAITIFAKMNNIDMKYHEVSFVTGETRSEWFRKINPMGAVPVLDDDGYILTESAAILRYLAAKYTVPENWYPSDLRQRGRVDEYLSWHYCPPGLRSNSAMVFIENSLKPHRSGNTADKKELSKRIEILNPVLDRMENYFLSRGDYIATSSNVTLADLVAICDLMQAVSTGYDVTEGRPRLTSWIARVKARLQPYFDETHQNFFDLFSKYRM